ncbi:D-alanyl-D-alanine carboxypeptidase family protein [Peptacetobacter sp.]|uniref:D-alanyl-D-alanine carboxypeptidase family protein n=1 Tax=Peptacetobacter sp. TaxID=2991975 RepID=UPI002E75BC06|nr:D-alanyl-D-alanine carboxypeptidase family protein [Peptacetobacter sp.]MEE0451522.1 D-alanyl-D-alanine carboxypeptidase family protein [Peptacetobacter sp.]
MGKILKKLTAIMLAVLFVIPATGYAAEAKKKPVAEIYSKNSILVDQKTGRVITSKEPDKQVPLASISKVMTFYVAQDAIKNGEVKKDDIVTIDKKMLKVSGSTMHLKEGEKVKFNELLKGLMIVSANDGAVAIASHVCKGDVDAFVERMNAKAKELGMKNTYFINPNGLPIYDWTKKDGDPKQNHSTARDIATMTKNLLDDYEEETIAITDCKLDHDPSRDCNYYNTNPLLHLHSNVDGLKTGYTDLAGYCLVFTDKMNSDGKSDIDNRMIGVVMGNWCKEDRVRSANALYNLGENFETKLMCKKGETVATGNIDNISGLDNIDLQPKRDCYGVVKNNEDITEKVRYTKVDATPNEETTVAYLDYIDQYGDVIQSVPLVSSDLEHISLVSRAKLMGNKIKRLFNIDKTDEKKELPYTVVV